MDWTAKELLNHACVALYGEEIQQPLPVQFLARNEITPIIYHDSKSRNKCDVPRIAYKGLIRGLGETGCMTLY